MHPEQEEQRRVNWFISAVFVWAVLSLIGISMISGCALLRKHNPELPANVALELNLADQLRQLERDYKTFFTDVGDAERSGQLTTAQVQKLNEVGHKLQPVIEHGNAAFKSWQANRADDSLKAAVTAAIQEGTALMLQLTSQQRVMLLENTNKRGGEK